MTSLNRDANAPDAALFSEGEWREDVETELCAATLTCGGETFTPDEGTAYFQFRLSHSLPSVTSYGTALHPGTILHSFRSMRHKVFNLGHLMRAYDPENIANDRILGSIAAVEWTGPEKMPVGGWVIPAKPEQAPGLRCVANVFKLAAGVDRIMGQSQAGRRQWQVSMEVRYFLQDSAFALRQANGDWVFIPWAEASAELRATWDAKKRSVTGTFQGQRPVLLMGGVDGRVQYLGVGLVTVGAEKTNALETMLASDRPAALSPGIAAARKFFNLA